MKRFVLILAFIMLFSCISFAHAEEEVAVYTSNDYEYGLLDDGTVEIIKYNGEAKKLEIPAQLDGYTVTSIGDHAFEDGHSLKEITIPDSISSIGDGAFYGCKFLKEINIPNGVSSINEYTFTLCESLKKITIPDSITFIDRYAFSFCKSLKEITIPDSVIYFGVNPDTGMIVNPFAGCTSLKRITVSLKHPTFAIIDNVLFDKTTKDLVCYPLALKAETYEIPWGIESISDSAFSGCESIKEIIIPDSVGFIGYKSFGECASLTEVTIPDSVTFIDSNAFTEDDSLTLILDEGSYAESFAEHYHIPYTYQNANDWLYS